jgi:tetratricopeptide (TPR) repeat protein
MQTEPTQPLSIFYCSAPQDEKLRADLDKHLSKLKRQNQIATWHERDILAGEEKERKTYSQLNTADIILLLISKDFIADDHFFKLAIRAGELHASEDAYVFSILLHPVDWKGTPFNKLHVVPTNLKSIAEWRDRDQAFHQVVGQIGKKINEIRTQQWQKEGANFYASKQYDEAITAYDHACKLDRNSFVAHYGMAQALRAKYIFTSDIDFDGRALAYFRRVTEIVPNLDVAHYFLGKELCQYQRYEEALAAFEQAIRYASNRIGLVVALYEKGQILHNLGKSKEALAVFDRIIQQEPTFTEAYESKFEILYHLELYEEGNETYKKALTTFENYREGSSIYAFATYGKGWSLYRLGRDEEALVAFDTAIAKYPALAPAYYGKGMVLHGLRKHGEALIAFDKAIERDPFLDHAYYGRGLALHDLKRYEEALEAFKQTIRIRPDYGRYHDEMGWTLERMGRLQEAYDAYMEARQLGFKR